LAGPAPGAGRPAERRAPPNRPARTLPPPKVFLKLDRVFPLFGVAAFAAFCLYLMGAAPGVVCHAWLASWLRSWRAGWASGAPAPLAQSSRHSQSLHPPASDDGRQPSKTASNQHPTPPPLPSPSLSPPLAPPVVAVKGNFLLGLNFLVVRLYPMRPGATVMSSFLVNVALVLAMSGAVTQFCASAFASYASNTIIFEIFGNDVGLFFGGLGVCLGGWGVGDGVFGGWGVCLGGWCLGVGVCTEALLRDPTPALQSTARPQPPTHSPQPRRLAPAPPPLQNNAPPKPGPLPAWPALRVPVQRVPVHAAVRSGPVHAVDGGAGRGGALEARQARWGGGGGQGANARVGRASVGLRGC
jgi:hypothetical protein